MEDPLARQAELIITSPMRRTIQTTLATVDWLVEKGVKIEADAHWQGTALVPCLPATTQFSSDLEYGLIRDTETTAKPCDAGTAVSKLAEEFPNVDYSTVDPVWPDKTSQAAAAYHYTRTAIIARGQAALQRLYERPEKIIIVVSHSAFLRVGVTGCWFFNADYRVFDFAPRGGPESPYQLEQHASTKEKGGGLGYSWTEQVQLGLDLPEEVPETE